MNANAARLLKKYKIWLAIGGVLAGLALGAAAYKYEHDRFDFVPLPTTALGDYVRE